GTGGGCVPFLSARAARGEFWSASARSSGLLPSTTGAVPVGGGSVATPGSRGNTASGKTSSAAGASGLERPPRERAPPGSRPPPGQARSLTSIETSLEYRLATATSGQPSPLTSATATETGKLPTA